MKKLLCSFGAALIAAIITTFSIHYFDNVSMDICILFGLSVLGFLITLTLCCFRATLTPIK